MKQIVDKFGIRLILDETEQLQNAVSLYDLKKAKECLKQGANPNGDNKYDINPLMIATTQGNLEIAKLLIDKGADVNAKCIGNSKGVTALMEACKLSCNTETAKLLIENGAEINAKDSDGHTALDYIVMSQIINSSTGQNFKEIKDFIISKGGKFGSQVKANTIKKSKTKQKSNDFEMGM